MGEPQLPSNWHNHEGYVAIFRAALQGICANPQFFGPIMQQSPRAAVEFAKEVLLAALQDPSPTPKETRSEHGQDHTTRGRRLHNLRYSDGGQVPIRAGHGCG